jgi:hypothetical protein
MNSGISSSSGMNLNQALPSARRRVVVQGALLAGMAALAGAAALGPPPAPPLTYAQDMSRQLPSQSLGGEGIELSLPFAGLWQAGNSPARQVPTHVPHFSGAIWPPSCWVSGRVCSSCWGC